MAPGDTMKGLKEFERDLDAVISQKALHETIRDTASIGDTLIELIIESATLGDGPGNQPYPDYSDSYQKRVDKAGGSKRFLRGIGREGREGGMLDPKRFSFEVEGNGTAFLVWKQENDTMGTYAEVHQLGLPLGRGGPQKQRMWLHFANQRNAASLVIAYDKAGDLLGAAFNANRKVGK